MAHIDEPRVRQFSSTTGTGSFTLGARGFGSLAITDVMVNGDTADFVASHQDSFQEFLGTLTAGVLVRTTTYISRHANGTVDTNNVSFVAGLKTLILVSAAFRAATLRSAVRYDVAQSLSAGELTQLQANLPRTFGLAGTRETFNQTTAPTGWTKLTDRNDYGIRIVTGSVADSGSVNYSVLFARTATDTGVIAQGNLPNVNLTHSLSVGTTNTNGTSVRRAGNDVTVQSGAGVTNVTQGTSQDTISLASGTVTGTVPLGGSANPFSLNIDMRVRTIDMILATKA